MDLNVWVIKCDCPLRRGREGKGMCHIRTEPPLESHQQSLGLQISVFISHSHLSRQASVTNTCTPVASIDCMGNLLTRFKKVSTVLVINFKTTEGSAKSANIFHSCNLTDSIYYVPVCFYYVYRLSNQAHNFFLVNALDSSVNFANGCKLSFV